MDEVNCIFYMRSWCDFHIAYHRVFCNLANIFYNQAVRSMKRKCYGLHVVGFITYPYTPIGKPCSKQVFSLRLMSRERPYSLSNRVCLLFCFSSHLATSWIYKNPIVLFLASLHERFLLAFTRLPNGPFKICLTRILQILDPKH